ncbi:hypothetical protein TKK_0008998 [Trichogramma kaykai]
MISEIKATDDFAGAFHFPSGIVDQRVEVFGRKGLIDATDEQEMEHCLNVALGKAQPLVYMKKIADACEKSARTGQSQELEWTADELPTQR